MRLVTVVFFVFNILCAYSQDGQYNFGARSAGIGQASSTLMDGWSLFNNIGSLGLIENSSSFLGYQNRYNIGELQSIAGGITYAHDWATIGIGVFRFGGDLFNEQKIKLAIGHKLDMISLGVGINVVQYTIEGLETKRRLAIEFGGTVNLKENLLLAAHIYNFQKSALIPTVMKAGLSYRPIKGLMINIETEKDIDLDQVFRAGVEYQIIAPIYLRTGLQTSPVRSSYGIGYVLKSFNLDYAFVDNTDLSSIHEISITYQFKAK
ncbi:MAG: hypothetical protein ACJA0X_000538 [Cyclobacteriaceae bacterium]|jgi:hypothetical protein